MTTPRTKSQAAYLNSLHSAAENMRGAHRALAAQASEAANFSSTSGFRPSVYSQNLTRASETLAVLHALMDLGGPMDVDSQDFKDALDPGSVFFTEEG